MSVTGNFAQKWVDIVPPEVPAYSVDPVLLALSAALFVAALVLGVIVYRRPRQKAKRMLRRLAHDLKRCSSEVKPACFQVRQCLRSGLGQPRLQSVPWGPANHAHWQAYLNRLTKCCFAAEPPSVVEVDGIIQEALAWLNKNKAGDI
jgi:hypothetical protein